MGLQLAPEGQTLPSRRVIASASSLALQMRAHCVGLWEGGFSSTHCGVAVVPGGRSLGHTWPARHFGEQKEPLRPVIVVFASPFAQGPSKGLP